MTDDQKINNDAEEILAEEVIAEENLERVVADEKNAGVKTEEINNEKKTSFFSRECKNCEKSKIESDEYKLGWQRALADYKNLQKETSERRSEWVQMSEVQILEDFIPVYDNFKKAFAHHPPLQADNDEHKQMKNWTDGIGYIMKQFGDVLKAHGIEEIKTVGEKLDTRYHEAVGEEAVEGQEAGTIIKEIDGGYKMREKVIRVAKVVLAN